MRVSNEDEACIELLPDNVALKVPGTLRLSGESVGLRGRSGVTRELQQAVSTKGRHVLRGRPGGHSRSGPGPILQLETTSLT